MFRALGRAAVATGAVALVASLGAATTAAQVDAPVTLRLAVADPSDRPSYPVVTDFVDAVSLLSDGAVTVEPIFDAAGDDFEVGTARMLLDGHADLAVVASRSWDQVGVTGLVALQTPFLIDTDALAVAFPASDVARDLLDSMAPHGVVGLTMWPEDLRHPLSLDGCADPFITPEAIHGLTIRTTGSAVTADLIETLGAVPVAEYEFDCSVHGGESGLLQGASLPPALRPTFTGDVTFSTKYQVLAANAASFERLSDAQRDAVREAAAFATERAIAARPSDAQAAAEWCATRGNVVLAGPAAVEAFEAAAQPVIDGIAADPAAAEAIAAIRALEAAIDPVPGPQACEYQIDPPGGGPPAARSEVPAVGSWRLDVSRDALAAAGLAPQDIDNVAGVYTWTFSPGPDEGSGTYQLHGQSPLWGAFECDGEYALNDDGTLLLRMLTIENCGGGEILVNWSTQPDGTVRVSVIDTPGMDPANDRALWESGPLVRID